VQNKNVQHFDNIDSTTTNGTMTSHHVITTVLTLEILQAEI